MNILTIVIAVLFLVFIVVGFWRGFVKSVFKILLTGLSLLLAYLLSPIISNILINNTTIDNTIRNKIYVSIEEAVEEKIKEEISESLGEVEDSMTEKLVDEVLEVEPNRNQQIDFIQNMELPEFLKKALIDNNHTEMKQEIGVSNFYDYISTYLSRMIINAIAFFLTFIILNILFTLTLFLMNMVVKLPGLNMVNRLGGAVFGFAEALLIVWLIFVLIDMIVGTKLGGELMAQINQSKMLTLINDKNLIAQLVENLIKGI